MRFTIEQYDRAIEALQDAKTQLAPDGRGCAICIDGGHQAWECRFNPLKAMALCVVIAQQSQALHESLHYLAGFDHWMGEPVGPAGISVPMTQEESDAVDAALKQSINAHLQRGRKQENPDGS